MRLGATLAHLSEAPPFAVADWASRLVGAGFESLWTPLVPDPFVTLAVAATATEAVELGNGHRPGPAPPPRRPRAPDPVASVGVRRRLTLGLGPGSTAVDYATFDRGYAARFRTFDENLARLRILLAHGRDDCADLAPAPGAAGGPPLLLGSWGAKVERGAREFDGWLASAYRRTPDQIIAAHERYRAAGGRRAIVCAIPLSRGRAARRS